MLAAFENAEMDRETPIREAITRLAHDQKMPVFTPNGKLNETKLAAELGKRAGATINQPTLNRFLNGKLAAKESTLAPFAKGFGISYVQFLAKIRPELQDQPASRPLSPEIQELWNVWERVPTRQRKFFMEQIKAAADFAAKFPDMTAVVNEEATVAASVIRIQQQRTKRQ